jgi:hypothetical protein
MSPNVSRLSPVCIPLSPIVSYFFPQCLPMSPNVSYFVFQCLPCVSHNYAMSPIVIQCLPLSPSVSYLGIQAFLCLLFFFRRFDRMYTPCFEYYEFQYQTVHISVRSRQSLFFYPRVLIVRGPMSPIVYQCLFFIYSSVFMSLFFSPGVLIVPVCHGSSKYILSSL